MASDIFSGLAEAGYGLFGDPGQYIKEWLSPELLKQVDLTTTGLPEYRAGQKSDLNRILAEIAGAKPGIAQIGKDDLSSLGQLASQTTNTRPQDVGRQFGDWSFAKDTEVAKAIAGFGKAEDNRLLANLQHGGQGGSTVQTNSILDRVSKNITPLYSNIFSSIPGFINATTSGDNARTANLLSLVRERAGIPLRGVQAEMIGSGLRTKNLNEEINALAGLGGAYRSNYLGTHYKPSRGEQVASAEILCAAARA